MFRLWPNVSLTGYWLWLTLVFIAFLPGCSGDRPAAGVKRIGTLNSQSTVPSAESSTATTGGELANEDESGELSEEEKNLRAAGLNVGAPAAINVSGHVRTASGEPMAKAAVYLVSMYLLRTPLAVTTSDADGRYSFHDAMLPTIQFDPKEPPVGTFQVIGQADDFGIAWHGCRSYSPQPRPANHHKDAQDSSLYQGEPIEMDLTMVAAKTLKGRITDERGRPVSNATIILRELDYLETENHEMHQNHRACPCIVLAPPGFCEVTSDESGQFEIPRLPDGSVAFLYVMHDDYAEHWLYTAMTDNPITEYRYIANHTISSHMDNDGKWHQHHKPIWETRSLVTNPLDIRMESTNRVTVTLVKDDGQPADKGCYVSASAGTKDHPVFSSGETDEKGQVILKLAPGEYELEARPPRKSDYITTKDDVIVKAEPTEQNCTLRLALGCVVIFEVTDAGTGKGIPGVDFMEDIGNGAHQGISNETTRADARGTDDNGKLRAVVFPGTRRYRMTYAAGYDSDLEDKEVNCEAGKTVRLQFKLSRK